MRTKKSVRGVMQSRARFEFGKNWQSFSRTALTEARIQEAKAGVDKLVPGEELRGLRVLDVGFGQGLFLLIAAEAGAQCLGIDIDPENEQALELTRRQFEAETLPETRIGSILDPAFLNTLLQHGPFDVVHSWGVLHHTGAMWEAIENCISLVSPQGRLVISIYNAHWSSPVWRTIKRVYNSVPEFFQKCLVLALFPIICIAKFLVTGRSPFRKERGMDFYHDVVDWVGGYPYEYASIDEIRSFVEQYGLRLEKLHPASVPTGCNEFVFRKVD